MNAFYLVPIFLLPLIHFLLYGSSYSKFFKLSTFLNSSKFISLLGVAMACYGVYLVIQRPLVEFSYFTFQGLGVELRLDRLNIILFTVITLIGLVVVRFSCSYLEGDPKHKRFVALIIGTIGSIQLFVLSGNLAILYLSWVLTSLFLHRLFLIYPEREKARLAAKKKFILARVGDVTLLICFALLYVVFETGNIAEILSKVQSLNQEQEHLIYLSGLFLALTAIFKSAQLPFHGWLIEVMEVPTPVSALLHAGLINAGPFLILRFAPVLTHSTVGQLCLFVFGVSSAIFGALTFVHQPSIKHSLGYSSIAHMGFTLTLCSIGAYSAALLHLIAHSFFKAHAFLTSGSEIDRIVVPQTNSEPIRLKHTFYGVSVALGISVLFVLWIEPNFNAHFAIKMVAYFFLFAVSMFIIQTIRSTQQTTVHLGIVLLSLITLGAFISFEEFFAKTTNLLTPTISSFQSGLSVIMLVCFIVVILLRMYFLNHSRYAHAIAIHLRNGLYFNEFINRLIGANKQK